MSCTSCNGNAVKGDLSGDSPTAKPSMEQLTALLMQDLARRGIDPDKVVASAPSGADNKVFDLDGELVDPDGGGPGAPTGVTLSWGEVCKGDYDQNGEVGISDLTPLGANFGLLVDYDDAASHDGFSDWPTGDPLDDGPPLAGSPAQNWRLARVDGDSNGEINLADITPIGAHFGQTMSAYCIYRKLPGEPDFTKLPNPDDSGLAYTVPRPAPDAQRPVRYTFQDDFAVGVSVSYYVAAYDTQSALEGPASEIFTLSTVANDPPVAAIAPDVSSGDIPLTVNFDASGSSDPDGTIAQYEWDLDGDGSYESDTGTTAANSKTYDTAGSFTVSLRVTDDLGATNVATTIITANDVAGPQHNISGTILDDTANTDPVANVLLTLTPGDITTTTDASGNYLFQNIDDGDYTLTPTLAGYGFTPTFLPVPLNGSDVVGDFTAHALPVGNLHVRGRVGDLFQAPPLSSDPWDSANPLPGIVMGAWDSNDTPGVDPPLGTDTTDVNGNYDIANLPACAGLVVQPVSPPPSGDAWFPPQGIFFPFDQDIPAPGDPPNGNGQSGTTTLDEHNFV